MEFDKVMLFYKRFLWLIGILPFDSRDFNFVGTRVLLGFFLVSSIANWNMYLFYGINGGAITVDYIYEVVLVYGMHIRYYMLLAKRKDLKKLIDDCESLWNECNEKEQRLVFKFERKIRKLFLFLFGSSNFVNVFYIFTAVNLNLHADKTNGTQTRHLPAKWFVVDRVDAWPGYEITFFLQVMLIFNACVISSIVDCSAPLLMMFSCGYFATLRRRLDRLQKSDNREDFERDFVAISKFHQNLLDFSSRIQKLGGTLFLCQLMCSGYNMSIIGIKLSGTDPHRFKYLPDLFTSLGELLICQYAPDYLLDESEAVSTAFYSTADVLIEHRSDYGKLLVLAILRASRPVQMTAGGVINLSMENFGQVIKNAFSFFMVLRSLNF